MSELKILVVDDELPARKKLISFLEQENKEHTIFVADNGIEAVELIRHENPELIFLDIQMPGKTGFEVVDEVGVENMPPVIFVTAYDQYAIEAFEVEAIDYLLKPFDIERFQKSVHRALIRIEAKKENATVLRKLLRQVNTEKKYLNRFMVNIGARFVFVNVDDVVYLSSEDKYINLHTTGDSYLLRDTLNNMEEQLEPAKFARIHRSSIINLAFIKEIQPWSHGDYIVVMKNGAKLKLSRRYKDKVFKNTK